MIHALAVAILVVVLYRLLWPRDPHKELWDAMVDEHAKDREERK